MVEWIGHVQKQQTKIKILLPILLIQYNIIDIIESSLQCGCPGSIVVNTKYAVICVRGVICTIVNFFRFYIQS